MADRKERRNRLRNDPSYVDAEKAYKRDYRLKTTEQRKTYMDKWRAANKEHVAAYKELNVEKAQEYNRDYAKKNGPSLLAKCRKRQAMQLQRVPRWITPEELWLIKEAYALAALRTKMTGVKWHVDHVVPLQGKRVSGLHVPNNLQVIPAVENIRKNNRFEVS